MTNEHENLPSGKLAEAVAYWSAQGVTSGGISELLQAARKYLALEPLLRELCEARGKASKDMNSWSGRKVDEDGYVYIPQGSYLGETLINLGDTYENSAKDCDFIATAANITARIREVVGE